MGKEIMKIKVETFMHVRSGLPFAIHKAQDVKNPFSNTLLKNLYQRYINFRIKKAIELHERKWEETIKFDLKKTHKQLREKYRG